ncbi:MAG: NADH-quinone oxidoreductase subunit C [Planctomycetes bacterium]|nr:NADH-quinone oxidoreductase subunit C [Planctomycetota bacterium]
MAVLALTRWHHEEAIPLDSVPRLGVSDFRQATIDHVVDGAQLLALFGRQVDGDQVRLMAVLGFPDAAQVTVFECDVSNRYPALTPECPQAHWFEREIAEQWGVVPEHHPWLKPIRFHSSYRPGHDAWGRAVGAAILPSVTDFFQVQGAEVHEVAVGPIHASVIEPGHFRFQCHGETVFHLEISLGFQHRDAERHLVGGPNKRTIHYMETLAGDTSIGHASAYCQALETLSNTAVPLRGQALRAIALELERMACHTGDLGALSDDVGFLPTAAFCGRLRGDYLNASAHLCGSRFGRGMVRPGGVMFDAEGERAQQLIDRLTQPLIDTAGAAQLLWDTTSVQARFSNTGPVSKQNCVELGMVGPAARACGVPRDVRRDYPSGIYRLAPINVSSWPTGDVYARAYVRALEIEQSGEFVLSQLKSLPAGPIRAEVGEVRPNSLAVGLAEGWRGLVCHVVQTNDQGKFLHYKVIDPSFRNWIGLAMSLRDQQISDFPLCNKSFNLSYCGHDL